MIVSIVTPSYNQGQFLEETIQSVLSQKGEFYIDYIIMDGGSTDNSLEIIKKYETLLKKNCTLEKKQLDFYIKSNPDFNWNQCHGISYRWFSAKDNGQVDALNKGFAMAKGQVFAFLNSDDIYYPRAFDSISRVPWEKTDIVYGRGIWISETGSDILSYPTLSPTPYSLYYQCTLCQPTVFFKKETFEELGEFSIDFPDTFDYEYWLRAAFAKKRFDFLKTRLAKSRMYDENKSLGQRKDISSQVRNLKEKYYDHSPQKLNKLKLFLTQFNVQRKTVKRVNKLFKIMGRDIHYHFWKKLKRFKTL